jgi:hypothetical protein
MNTLWSPSATDLGVVMTSPTMVFSALTTRVSGEGSLDLLTERVGVIDEEVRWKALGEFEWVGHIEQHLADEIGLAGLIECGDRPSARGGVDEQVSVRCRVGKGRKAPE